MGRSPGEIPVATHSGLLAWESPWTEEPGGIQPVGGRGEHDYVTEHSIHTQLSR